MSWRATAAVKAMCEGLTRTEKFVLLTLADYHNDETGQCDPSIGRLAREVLSTDRATQLVLGQLAVKNFIRIERRRAADGRQTSNQYWLICLGDMGGEGEMISPPNGGGEGDRPIRGRVIARSGEGDRPITGEGDRAITQSVSINRNKNRKVKPQHEPQSRGALPTTDPRDAILRRIYPERTG